MHGLTHTCTLLTTTSGDALLFPVSVPAFVVAFPHSVSTGQLGASSAALPNPALAWVATGAVGQYLTNKANCLTVLGIDACYIEIMKYSTVYIKITAKY